MAAKIRKILNFSEAIREWSLVPSSVQNLQQIALSLTVMKLGEQYILQKLFNSIEATSDLLIGQC